MCLEKDPLRRWTCDQLLRHPFFDNFSFKYPEGDLYEFEKLKTFREKSKVSDKSIIVNLPQMYSYLY